MCLDSVCFIKDSQFFVTVNIIDQTVSKWLFPILCFFCKFYLVEFIVIMC